MNGRKGYVVIIGVFAIIILALIVSSIYFQRTHQMEMAEQFNRQQLLLANAHATSIQDYLGGIKNELIHIARSASQYSVRSDADFKFITDGVFRDGGVVKKQVVFLDSRGTGLFTRGNAHAPGPDEKNLIMRLKTMCPADVLTQQDAKTISFIAPVCRLDSLTGAVMITLDIQDIAKAFLGSGSLKAGSNENAWMMDEKGNLLYHPTKPDMVGRNLNNVDSTCFSCHKSFDVERKIIQGRGDYCSGDYYGRYVAPTGEDKILAYSSAMAGDSRWIVAVSAPYSAITLSIKRSTNLYTWIIVLIAMTSSAVSAWLIVLNQKREQAEERAKHEKELEMMHAEKLASLERLTSGITSEIGNPLTSVFSFIQVLRDIEEDEFKKETVETIFLHMNRIADILKQLSSFSKSQVLALKPCKVNTVIENSLSLIQYDKRVQDITIVKDLKSGIPVIATDGSQLSQVVVNLVLNAADAMPNGGTLTIRSRVQDGGITIDFEDTGVGISKEVMGRIFDPFFSTKEQGTGLGLAVSYNIIRKLGGSITAESEPGKGSRFVITLPAG
ncbi:MAG TPA: ATP-binding protein [Nitrospirota bacterium]|nr:ATP-binding protein [Nitrospirota bacterium]